jgi:hypothetical protein
MKRPITRRVRTIWTRTAASVLGCWLGLAGAQAQEMPPPILPPVDAPAPITPAPIAPPPVAQILDSGPPTAQSVDFPVDPLPKDNVSPAIFFNKPGSPSGIQQTNQTVAPITSKKDRPEEPYSFAVDTELPGLDRITRRISEKDFFEEIKQDYGTGKAIFPPMPPLTTEVYQRRQFPHIVRGVEPANVVHGRLYFEQPNFERTGWDLGVLSPFVNMGKYYYDLALLPYHCMTRPFEKYEVSAGKCLPGDPAPLFLYPEEFSVTGLVGETAVITGLWYLFP